MYDLARMLVAFFAIIDPIGNVLIFYLLTQGLSPRQRAAVATVAVTAAGALLAAFAVGGRELLVFLGISPASFRVAAGLLLLLPAYRLVAAGQPLEWTGEKADDPFQVALVPLAVPLIAGPGALATAISYRETRGLGSTVLAMALVLLLSLGCFLAADWLFRRLGVAQLRLLSRLVGVLLFAIAVEFVLDGLRVFFGLGGPLG
jgi:multiple antibiotic resistance protein